MIEPFCYLRRIEFRDTDAAGIVHFSVFFNYMEEAEHALLRELGLDVFLEDEDGPISFPRVAASCDYRSPLRFDETVSVYVTIFNIGSSSVTFHHEFKRDATQIASGQITTVCCRLQEDGPARAIEIPSRVRDALAKASS
jgi:acyl-CoA thioester hydrolase